MNPNSIKRKLGQHEIVTGFGLSMGSLRSAEISASTAFDFVMVDTLHGHFDKASATDALRSLARTGRAPFARVSGIEYGPINDFLDAGAVGIVVPMVCSREDAEKAVNCTFYPPLGRRSKGSIATVIYGSEYASRANDEIALIVMVETPDAVEKAEEIVSVGGVDGCLIGASDLSFVMGVGKQSPQFIDAVRHVRRAGAKRQVAVGISVGSVDEALFWAKEGLTFFLTSHDLALLVTCIGDYDRSFDRLREYRLT